MIAFIDEHRAVYGVEPICRVLPIAPSTYHVHAARQADPAKLPPRAEGKSDAMLMIEVVSVTVVENVDAEVAIGQAARGVTWAG